MPLRVSEVRVEKLIRVLVPVGYVHMEQFQEKWEIIMGGSMLFSVEMLLKSEKQEPSVLTPSFFLQISPSLDAGECVSRAKDT